MWGLKAASSFCGCVGPVGAACSIAAQATKLPQPAPFASTELGNAVHWPCFRGFWDGLWKPSRPGELEDGDAHVPNSVQWHERPVEQQGLPTDETPFSLHLQSVYASAAQVACPCASTTALPSELLLPAPGVHE